MACNVLYSEVMCLSYPFIHCFFCYYVILYTVTIFLTVFTVVYSVASTLASWAALQSTRSLLYVNVIYRV